MTDSIMDRRLSREISKAGSVALQKKIVGADHQTRRRRSWKEQQVVRDLTDFMNDMFFGTADIMDKKTYDLTGGCDGGRGYVVMDDDDDFGFDDSTRSNSGRLTEGWLEEARLVLAASSPSNNSGSSRSPGRRVGSPRFAAASSLLALDRRDPLSRSARRNKAAEGLGEEILSKSSKHAGNKSDTTFTPPPLSPSHHYHHGDGGHGSPATPPHTNTNPNPPRPRKSRFQAQPKPNPSPAQQTPPRRSFSHSLPLSPPQQRPTESSDRRSRSSSSCSHEIIADSVANGTLDHRTLNAFLKHQSTSLLKILNRELAGCARVTVVLSGHSNSVASMVAAICHAWLLSCRQREERGAAAATVVPVMNVRRGAMWKLRQAAWLFHHAGLDAAALLFSDEVDLEKLMMTGQLSVLVVGQDILCATGEVGSQCTILTDNFCEDAYDLLEDPVLKKLLLAGILLDTENLKAPASITMTRDAEAVQLLLVGSAPNYRYALFDQLMQDQKANSFVEVLSHNYGKPPDEGENTEGNVVHKIGEGMKTFTSDCEPIMSIPKKNYVGKNVAKTNKISPKSAKLISPPLPSPPGAARAEMDSSRGKNKFFLAKWFGFGSK